MKRHRISAITRRALSVCVLMSLALHSFYILLNLPSSSSGGGKKSRFSSRLPRDLGDPPVLFAEDETKSYLWDHFACDAIFSKTRPILKESVWAHLQNLHRDLVSNTRKKQSSLPYQSGFHVPIKVKQTKDGKGRGLFAAEHIPAGTLLWESTQTVLFRSVQQYRQFLLAADKDLACDLMQWSYTTKYLAKEKNFTVCVDLDEGALMNSAWEEGQTSNIVSVPDVQGGCNQRMFASTDINKGQEIICDYGDFVKPTSVQL